MFYHFGHDKSLNGLAQQHKAVLQPVNINGSKMEIYMDISKLCPPFCDCDKPGYPPCKTDDTCTLTDVVIRNAAKDEAEAELDVYRYLRDQFMIKKGYGPLVEMYYYISPALIEAIENSGRKEQVYSQLYHNEIAEAYALINERKYQEAKELFEATMALLTKEFLFNR
jgi:ribosome biogenesis GTPase A